MNLESPQAAAAIIAGAVSLVTMPVTAIITLIIANRNIRNQLELAERKVATDIAISEGKTKTDILLATEKLQREHKLDYAAERVAHDLLSNEKWRWRSFRVIRHYLGGFTDDELRKILVRSGAIRTMTQSGSEVWGLLERNNEVVRLPKEDLFLPEDAPTKLFGEM